jgi:acetoin utilization protein AcuB
MLVADLMTGPLVTIGHDATVADAWSIIRSRQVRHLPVLDSDRRLIGMVTDHDLRLVILERCLREEPGRLAEILGRLRVNEIMTWAVITVRPDADIRDAARIMHDHKLGALAVVADGRVVGILTATDVIQAVVGSPESSVRDRTGASR